MSTGTEKKPSIKAQAPQTYLQVGAGIYRYKDKKGKVTYHERPSINGSRTYRSLGYNFTAQHNIKLAREESSFLQLATQIHRLQRIDPYPTFLWAE